MSDFFIINIIMSNLLETYILSENVRSKGTFNELKSLEKYGYDIHKSYRENEGKCENEKLVAHIVDKHILQLAKDIYYYVKYLAQYKHIKLKSSHSSKSVYIKINMLNNVVCYIRVSDHPQIYTRNVKIDFDSDYLDINYDNYLDDKMKRDIDNFIMKNLSRTIDEQINEVLRLAGTL